MDAVGQMLTVYVELVYLYEDKCASMIPLNNTAYSHRLTFIPTPADLIIIRAFFPVTTQLNFVLNSFGVSIYKSERTFAGA